MFANLALVVAALALVVARAVGQIGPFAEESKLAPPVPGLLEQFGWSAAVSGDTAVIGAPGYDAPGKVNAGAAYVFVRSDGTWTFQATLLASDPGNDDEFGHAVAVSGDTILVGAFGKDSVTDFAGATYIFVRTGTDWAQLTKIIDPSGPDDDIYGAMFGYSVDLAGDTAVIGSPTDDVVLGEPYNQAARGSAYVYVREGTVWHQEAKLTAPDGADEDYFGGTVAISENTIVVGRLSSAAANGHTRSAYVFTKSGGVWTNQAALIAPPPEVGGSFAGSVAVSGDTLACSDPETSGMQVFLRDAGLWSLQATLVPNDAPLGAGGPMSVALAGNLAVLCVESPSPFTGEGYVFKRQAGTWSQHATLSGSDTVVGDQFGSCVDIDAQTVVVGDNYATTPPAGGRAYAFLVLPIGTWQDLGLGMAGATGTPTLTPTGYLQATSPVSLALAHAKPFSLSPLVVGFGLVGAPFKGGVMVPTPDLVFPALSDFFGGAVFAGQWPSGVPSGFITYFQWWVQDASGPKGFAASNGLAGTTP